MEVCAIKRLEEFSNNQGEAKLIAADISTLRRLNHMNLNKFWGIVLKERTEYWCTSTWKMGHWLKIGHWLIMDLACHILDLLHKVDPSEVVVGKDDKTLMLVFDEVLGGVLNEL
ncbi:hypothetical protein Tco_1457478 [Tanacetum coccineum]